MPTFFDAPSRPLIASTASICRSKFLLQLLQVAAQHRLHSAQGEQSVAILACADSFDLPCDFLNKFHEKNSGIT